MRRDPEAMLAMAARYAAAAASGDAAEVRSLCEAGAIVWHNHDGVEQTLEQNARVSRWLRRTVPDLRFEEVRLAATSEGFVERHVLTGTAPGGGALRIPCCLVATVSPSGRIERLEEYLDSAQLRPLLGGAREGRA